LFFTLAVVILTIVALSGCLEENNEKTYKITAIKPNELPNYIGQKVGINLTPNFVRDEETYNFYYKVNNGRAGTSKRSIYYNHKVYDTVEGIKLATSKNTRLAAKKNIIVIGTVWKDDYTPGNLIIGVEAVIEEIGPNGGI
jgi:hypothetical protein